MAEFSRLVKAAHAQYSRILARETLQQRLLLAWLKEHGRIEYNASGTSYDWRIRRSEHDLIGVDDLEVLEFARSDQYESATVPYRELVMHDAISTKEIELTDGPEKIIELYKGKMKQMGEDFQNALSAVLWIDGNATANVKKFHGIESCLADDNATAAGASEAAASDSYAGLSTVVGALEADTASPGYRAYTPRLKNATETGKTWAGDAISLIRELCTKITFGQAKTMRPSLFLASQASYLPIVELFDARERFTFAKGAAAGIGKLGFTGIMLDGIEISWDFDVPATVSNPGSKTVRGYALNPDALLMKLSRKQNDVFRGDSHYEHGQRGYVFLLQSIGNFIIEHPRKLGKIAEYA